MTGISPYTIALQFVATLEVVEIPVLNANSIETDQMSHYVASDLGLHCQCPILGKLGKNGLMIVCGSFFYFTINTLYCK